MHVCVCICTYKRPKFLRRLLEELSRQQTDGLFSYSIVVADNDREESARPAVTGFAEQAAIQVTYCAEREQNIALARNKALQNATGDFIAFIDDDEFPTPTWLLTLFRACQTYQAQGALGPVKPYFEQDPPRWVVKGGFYDRRSYETGLVIDWRKGRTGNVLFERRILEGVDQPFRPDFRTGEDQDFFRRMIEKGHRFVWCHEAIAYEVVPPIRWKLSFMLRRALLRGRVAALEPECGARDMVRSTLAVILYAAALPFLFVAGRHLFMRYCVKLFDHLGKVLGLLGLDPVKEGYVTE